MAESLKTWRLTRRSCIPAIWRQFVACQMTPAQYEEAPLLQLTVGAGEFRLKARGRILLTAGQKATALRKKSDEDRAHCLP